MSGEGEPINMSTIPADLKYTSTHEWLRIDADGLLTLGITDHAQHLLGDLVFVELPEISQTLQVGDDLAVVESVKAASDVYAPIQGEVVVINETLQESPEQVNSDPYGDGWIVKIKPLDEDEVVELLDAKGYSDLLAEA